MHKEPEAYPGAPRTKTRRGKLRRVDLETFVCSIRGHVVPAAKVARLRPQDAGLGVDLPDGRRLGRCLRCDAWIQVVPPTTPSRDVLPPISQLQLPRRGKELKDAVVLRLIALDRAVHCVLFGLLAVLLFVLEINLGGLKTTATNVLRDVSRAAGQTGQGATQDFVTRTLERILDLRSHTLLVLMFTATGYAVVEGVEAVGLWLERRWAEYLTALATAGFLPFEIHELILRITVLRIGALVVNVAILVYLVWAKRLFGVRGGARRETREEEFDRQELFGPPIRAAAKR